MEFGRWVESTIPQPVNNHCSNRRDSEGTARIMSVLKEEHRPDFTINSILGNAIS